LYNRRYAAAADSMNNGGDSDDPVTNAMAVNFSGRFKSREARDLGQALLGHVVNAKHVGLVLGQQVRDLER